MSKVLGRSLYRGLLRQAQQLRGRALVAPPLSPDDVTSFHILHEPWDGFAAKLDLPKLAVEHRPSDPYVNNHDLTAWIRRTAKAAAGLATAEKVQAQSDAFSALRLIGEMLQVQDSTTSAVTNGVRITVTAKHITHTQGSQVPPDNHHFLYKVRFDNTGSETVRLLARHLQFCDASTNEILLQIAKYTPCVVGEQPIILPSEGWEYISQTLMAVKRGYFTGSYLFQKLGAGKPLSIEEDTFEAVIPPTKLTAE